jgi:hypothetical protein
VEVARQRAVAERLAVLADERPEPAAVAAVAGPGRALLGHGERLPARRGTAVGETFRERLAVAVHRLRDLAEPGRDVLPALRGRVIHQVEDGARAGRRAGDDAQPALALAAADHVGLALEEIAEEARTELLVDIGRLGRGHGIVGPAEEVLERIEPGGRIVGQAGRIALDAPALAPHGIELGHLGDVAVGDLGDGRHESPRRMGQVGRVTCAAAPRPTMRPWRRRC